MLPRESYDPPLRVQKQLNLSAPDSPELVDLAALSAISPPVVIDGGEQPDLFKKEIDTIVFQNTHATGTIKLFLSQDEAGGDPLVGGYWTLPPGGAFSVRANLREYGHEADLAGTTYDVLVLGRL